MDPNRDSFIIIVSSADDHRIGENSIGTLRVVRGEMFIAHNAIHFSFFTNHDWGLKYRTMPAPAAAIKKPTYSIGFGAVFGGCNQIENKTFTKGAPAKTSGMTYAGTPP